MGTETLKFDPKKGGMSGMKVPPSNSGMGILRTQELLGHYPEAEERKDKGNTPGRRQEQGSTFERAFDRLTRTILKPPGSPTAKRLQTELFTKELCMAKRGMQPNVTYVNLTESEIVKFTVSLMMNSNSDNSSEVSSHVSADKR